MTHRFLARSGACRLFVWSLTCAPFVACGAFEGGQSGTDSLEAIGVHKPAKGCEENDKNYDVGDKMSRGCEECVCQDNGKWECVGDISCSAMTRPSSNEVDTSPQEGADQTTNSATATSGAFSTAPTDEESNDDTQYQCVREIPEPSIGGSNGVYVATDAHSTACVTQVSPTKLCMVGSIVDPGTDYEFWGGGIGLVMASASNDQTVPFDAPSLGIESVRFTLTGIDDFLIRAYINQANDPNILDSTGNFVANGFVLLETTTNGTFTLPIESAYLPDWTRLDVDNDGQSDPETPIDPTQLISLQLFIASQPSDGTGFGFDVCVSDVEWLDSEGNTVLPAE